MIPYDRHAETVRGLRAILGDDMRSVQDRLRAPVKKLPRKRVGKKYCGGITCLPGKGGKCTACSDDD